MQHVMEELTTGGGAGHGRRNSPRRSGSHTAPLPIAAAGAAAAAAAHTCSTTSQPPPHKQQQPQQQQEWSPTHEEPRFVAITLLRCTVCAKITFPTCPHDQSFFGNSSDNRRTAARTALSSSKQSHKDQQQSKLSAPPSGWTKTTAAPEEEQEEQANGNKKNNDAAAGEQEEQQEDDMFSSLRAFSVSCSRCDQQLDQKTVDTYNCGACRATSTLSLISLTIAAAEVQYGISAARKRNQHTWQTQQLQQQQQQALNTGDGDHTKKKNQHTVGRHGSSAAQKKGSQPNLTTCSSPRKKTPLEEDLSGLMVVSLLFCIECGMVEFPGTSAGLAGHDARAAASNPRTGGLVDCVSGKAMTPGMWRFAHDLSFCCCKLDTLRIMRARMDATGPALEALASALDATASVSVPPPRLTEDHDESSRGAALLSAAFFADMPVLRQLVAPLRGVPLERWPVTYGGLSVLHLAVRVGSLRVCAFLLGLEHRIDQYMRDDALARKVREEEGAYGKSTTLQACKHVFEPPSDEEVNKKKQESARMVPLPMLSGRDCICGDTPLTLAICHERFAIVRLLLDAGCDPNDVRKNGKTRAGALCLAVGVKSTWLCSLLLARGAHVNASAPDRTPALAVAVRHGLAHVAIVLLGAGASVKRDENLGTSPLALAVRKHHVDVVCTLLGLCPDSYRTTTRDNQVLKRPCAHASGAHVSFMSSDDLDDMDEEGNTALMVALRLGHLDICHALLDAGAQLPEERRNAMFVVFASNNTYHTCKWMLTYMDVDVNARIGAGGGECALALCAWKGYANLARLLMEHGADMHANEDPSYAPVVLAASYGHLRVLCLLLGVSDSPYLCGAHKDVALSGYERYGSNRKCGDDGASVEGVTDCDNSGGQRGRGDCRGDKDDVHDPQFPVDRVEQTKIAMEEKVQVETRKSNCERALIMAVRTGSFACCRVLLDFGIDVNLCDETIKGRTLLMLAAEGGFLHVCRLLVKRGADLNRRSCPQYSGGETALILAAFCGRWRICRLMLRAGADSSLKQRRGYTAFMLAVRCGNAPVAAVFAGLDPHRWRTDRLDRLHVDRRASHDDVDDKASKSGDNFPSYIDREADIVRGNIADGDTPLMTAVKYGHVTMCRLLLSIGANPNDCTRSGSAALLIAAGKGFWEICSLLIARGSDINHQVIKHVPRKVPGDGADGAKVISKCSKECSRRDCPLTISAWNGHLAVVQLLLKHGACMHKVQNTCKTPLQLAALNGCDGVLALLLKHQQKLVEETGDGWCPVPKDGTIVPCARPSVECGVVPLSPSADRNKAFRLAIAGGHVVAAKRLFDVGARIQCPALARQLFIASCARKRVQMCEMLLSVPDFAFDVTGENSVVEIPKGSLKAPACSFRKDGGNTTFFILATSMNSSRVCKWLLERRSDPVAHWRSLGFPNTVDDITRLHPAHDPVLLSVGLASDVFFVLLDWLTGKVEEGEIPKAFFSVLMTTSARCALVHKSYRHFEAIAATNVVDYSETFMLPDDLSFAGLKKASDDYVAVQSMCPATCDIYFGEKTRTTWLRRSLLMLAVIHNSADVVRLILSKNVDINYSVEDVEGGDLPSKQYVNALTLASRLGHREVCKILFDCGARPTDEVGASCGVSQPCDYVFTGDDRCGHKCNGVYGEAEHPPCLHVKCRAAQRARSEQGSGGCSGVTVDAGAEQTVEDFCRICYSCKLGDEPVVRLKSCGHIFHHMCLRKLLDYGWRSCTPYITFRYRQCPLCCVEMEHPEFSELRKASELYKSVCTLAMKVFEYGTDASEYKRAVKDSQSRYHGKPLEYALSHFAFYQCFECSMPYFGGTIPCEVNGGSAENEGGEDGSRAGGGAAAAVGGLYNNLQERKVKREDMRCASCLAKASPGGPKLCGKHGGGFMVYKCRFCCSPATYFCFGTTHFCVPCHRNAFELQSTPVEKLVQCPCLPSGVGKMPKRIPVLCENKNDSCVEVVAIADRARAVGEGGQCASANVSGSGQVLTSDAAGGSLCMAGNQGSLASDMCASLRSSANEGCEINSGRGASVVAMPLPEPAECTSDTDGSARAELEVGACPLGVKHPPSGEEFLLGCALCEDMRSFLGAS